MRDLGRSWFGCLKRSLKFYMGNSDFKEEFQEAIPTPQNSQNVYFSRWWQLKYFFFLPRTLGKSSNLTSIFFKGVVQPPTSCCLWLWEFPQFFGASGPNFEVGWGLDHIKNPHLLPTHGFQRMSLKIIGGKWTIWTCISYWKWWFSERKVFILKSEFLGKWTSLWKSLVQRDDRLPLWWVVGGEGLVRCFFFANSGHWWIYIHFWINNKLWLLGAIWCYEIVIGFRKGRRFQQKGG